VLRTEITNHWPVLLLVAAGVGVLWTAAVLSKYVRLMLNIIRDTPRPPLMGPLDYERVEGRSVWFRAFDGTLLRGMVLSPELWRRRLTPSAPGPDEPTDEAWLSRHARGVIIFCHEFGSDRYSCARYCRALLEAGFDVFSFDFRSQGASGALPGYQPRLWCTNHEVADVLGALAVVQAQLEAQGLQQRLGLFGVSRGGAAALLAAGAAGRRTPLGAVLADGAFSNDILLETMMKKWVHIFARVRFLYENHPPAFWRFLRWLVLQLAQVRFGCTFLSVRRGMRQLRQPVFLIHGQKDSYIQAEQTAVLHGLAGTPRYLWLVAEARHNQSVLVDAERYASRTLAFFEKHLAGGAAPETHVAEAWRADVQAFLAWPGRSASVPAEKATRDYVGEDHRVLRRAGGTAAIAAVPEVPEPLPQSAKRPVAARTGGQ